MRNHAFIEGEFYHVYAHGVNGLDILQNENDRRRFLTLIFVANGIKPTPRLDRKSDPNLVWDIIDKKVDIGNALVDVVCFCLMPTHFHLLLGERGDGNISKYLHKILVSFSKYYNIKNERRGHVFEGTFNSKHIDSNDYLLTLSSYIHKNPKEIKQWRGREEYYYFSSYQDYISDNRWADLMKRNIILEQFNSNDEYKKFIEEHNHYEDEEFDPN